MTVLPVTGAQTGNTDLVQVLPIRTQNLLGSGQENIAFFCSNCLPKVVDVLTLYQTYHKLDSELYVKFQCMENQLHKGIRQHVVNCFEAANVAGLEDTCKQLQASVDDLGLKVENLAQSNSNLMMEIDSASKSFTEPPKRKPTFTPPCFVMDIID